MSKDIAISVKEVNKSYKLYNTHADRVKETFHPLRKKYHRPFNALVDVQFDVSKGETLGIIGRNGSGKSTLLQIICGILQPTSGNVEVNGKISALLELGTGFNPEFTGRQNVYINGSILGLTHDEIENRFDEIAAFADIGQYIDQPVKTYSSGMSVRLSFAVAISIEPDILIIDEALAVGDEAFQRKCYAKINQLSENGTTILFVSHATSVIVELCNKAILLDEGEKIYSGEPKKAVEIYHKLIFSPDNKRAEIRAEVQSIQEKGAEKTVPLQSNKIEGSKQTKQSLSLKSFFDPNLVSQSRMEYEKRGVEIVNPHIETLSGERVNNLVNNEKYIFTYVALFYETATQVQFGMLIKKITGMEIGGAAHPSLFQYLGVMEKDQEIIIRFKFHCMLNPGVYFFNAGVIGENRGEVGYISRIIDAVAFRVQSYKGQNGTGVVNFGVSSTTIKKPL